MSFQWCRNCQDGAPRYPHHLACPRPKYVGEPDPDAVYFSTRTD